MDISGKQKYIFSMLFLLANKIQVTGDRLLSEEMTIRQWLLTAAVAELGEAAPAISQVAKLMGSSRQNVKQLALKLQEKGYLIFKKDERDSRTTRICLTEKNLCFWRRNQAEVRGFLNEIFHDFGDDELDLLYQCLNKLYESIEKNRPCLKSMENALNQ